MVYTSQNGTALVTHATMIVVCKLTAQVLPIWLNYLLKPDCDSPFPDLPLFEYHKMFRRVDYDVAATDGE